MENMQPSIWDVSCSGTSSSAPAGGPYVDLRTAGEGGCEAAPRVEFPSMALAVPGTAGEWEQPSDLSPQST